MKANIVRVIKNELSEAGNRLIQVIRRGKSDSGTPYYAAPHNTDAPPIKDVNAVQVDTNTQGRTVIVGYLLKDGVAEPGEYRVFATDDDGEVKAEIHLHKDGSVSITGANDVTVENDNGTFKVTEDGDVEINGNDDNMVRFSELKSGHDELRTDLNNFINAYLGHTHIALSGGTSTPIGVTPTPSTASIDGAKIDNVKTN